MAAHSQGGAAANVDLFDEYFRRADLDRDGRISGAEAVAFLKGSNLPQQVLAQIWTYADQNRQSYLGRAEFYNALKLVTVAQSNRALTPDIVKAALYSQASAKIPVPKINFSSISPLPSNSAGVTLPTSQMGTAAASPQNPGVRGLSASASSTNMPQQYNQSQINASTRLLHTVSGVAASPGQMVGNLGTASGGYSMGLNVSNPGIQNNPAVGNTAGTPSGMVSQFLDKGTSPLTMQAGSGYEASSSVASLPPRPPATSGVTQSTSALVDPKSLVSQNGFASDSPFDGDAFSAIQSHPKKDNSGATELPAKQGSIDLSKNSSTAQPVGGQLQWTQSLPNQNQQTTVQNTSNAPGISPQASVGNQSQMQWPKMTESDVQKYTKVFLAVDTDRDGKITGPQARSLFLSWRLPIEVLKQVWDLSDQDNDSMLSLREFCIALYLMERYREGRPLPSVLPSNITFHLPTSIPSTTGYGNAALGYSPGFQQQQAMPGLQSKQQKAKVPVLEKHLVDQLSDGEQKSLNTKFQEATEANKKVEELEKEIKESRERMEFYRAKMQELVLYKSRCDSRLNEIMQRAAADKLEVESLAKKYEEKYRQTGDVASKLTIEEATFRDIQERKMELYRAIVKMEQEGNTDDSLQVSADRIQSNLEELVKSLSERCKKYGLRGKPTTLLELPFGWQPGIQEGAADWDEDWDKFEDEGFTFVKELTLDVQNVIAPPKTKAKTAKKGKGSLAEHDNTSASLAAEAEEENPSTVAERAVDEGKIEKPATVVERVDENGLANDHTEDASTRSPLGSPVARSSHKTAHDEVTDNHGEKTDNSDASPHSRGSKSKRRVGDPSFSGNMTFDEPAWAFDTNDDVDSMWGFGTASTSKGFDHERDQHDDFFGPGGLSLNPIKTGSASADSNFQRKGPSIFLDSVPSTPNTGSYIQRNGPSIFSDSVPSTPYTESNFPRRGPSIFADSVPSTPLHSSSYSPRRNNEGPDEQGFNFSRFDSFGSTDTGFQPQEMLARFDSMRSMKDFDHGYRFSSFDESDPSGSGLGSLGLSRSSFDSETPRRESDSLSFGGTFKQTLGSETPRTEDPFGGPFRSSLGSETPRTDFDPFGSSGPFRSSLGSETPKAGLDAFGSSGPFNSLFTSETPRGTNNWSAF
ncbi:hypothetical protein Ancab_017203 [Ancistrocladus abbreviatus]